MGLVCDTELGHRSGSGMAQARGPTITYERIISSILDKKPYWYLNQNNIISCQEYKFEMPSDKIYFVMVSVCKIIVQFLYGEQLWFSARNLASITAKRTLFGSLIVWFWCVWHVGDSIRSIQTNWSCKLQWPGFSRLCINLVSSCAIWRYRSGSTLAQVMTCFLASSWIKAGR